MHEGSTRARAEPRRMVVRGLRRLAHSARSALLTGATAALVAGGWVGGAAATDSPGVSPGKVTRADLGTRLRVFARVGDPKLENEQVTAVVRASDGWLVDYWRNHAILPTSPQLGATTNIDGLWKVYQVLTVAKRKFEVVADQVVPVSDGIRTEAVTNVGRAKLRVVTTYRLDPLAARLRLVTEVSAEGSKPAGPIGIGDVVKWGNVQFHVDGLPRPRLKYSGRARWVGRRGAGGDLLLRTLEQQRMRLDFSTSRRGFSGTITAVYSRAMIPAPGKGSVRVSRELSYEPLPITAPAPPPRVGTLTVKVRDEKGSALPAKVRIDRKGRQEPLFDDDGDLYGAYRFMWTGNGQLSRELAPGRYVLLVSCGIERDVHRETVQILADRESRVTARLPRVLHTPGWIGSDLHFHQAPSVDSGISLPIRAVSIAAEGVEFAVTSDHYVVTDLGPTVRWLRREGVLSVPLSTMVGSEVSTIGHRFGHFNVFPLRTDQNVKYRDTNVDELFADARRVSPNGVLQVNHPRLGIGLGYFNYYGLDDATAKPTVVGYNPSFDTVEVFNGDDARDTKLVRRVLEDWMHLLGQGQRYAATGGSDSHKLAFHEPGVPRTFIRYGDGASDAADVNAPHAQIIAALKAGHAIVTTGPFIEATVAGRGPGETARSVGARAKLRIVVRAAPWIDVSEVEVLEGGQARQVHWARVPRSRNVVRFDQDVEVAVQEKTFFVVIARGARPLPNTGREYIVPYALTNPIWVEP
jgi:hypothetical protein